jgi:hypothetical protein
MVYEPAFCILIGMKLSIHRLVLCLLLLVAIPLQGYASSVMVACDSSRVAPSIGYDSHTQMHGATQQSGSAHHSTALVDVGLSRFAEAAQDTTHSQAVQHTANTHHAQPDDAIGESAAQHSCCSACVMGALDSSMVFSQPLGNPTQFNYSSATHVPPTLAGLERPPRRHLG